MNYKIKQVPPGYVQKNIKYPFTKAYEPIVQQYRLEQKAKKQIQTLLPPTQKIIDTNKQSNTVSLFSKKQIFDSGIQFIRNNIKSKPIMPIKKDTNLPKSIQFLQTYAQSMGFAPMGSVIQKNGSNMIGRIHQMAGNKKYFRSFPSSYVKNVQSPNLYINFTSLANDAIHKWNQFVNSQQNLAMYLQKISTPKGRQQLMSKYAKLSNYGTNALRVLSSLAYHYLQPKSQNKNYLQLKTQQDISSFRSILTNSKSPTAVYQDVLNFMSSKKDNIPQDKKIKIARFHDAKVQAIRQSLNQYQFARIKEQLNSLQCYIPPQMLILPAKQTPQWFQYYQSIKKNQFSVMVMTTWYQNQNKYIKYINYF